MEKAKWFLVLLLFQSLLLIGCSSEQDKWQQQLDQQVLATQTKLSRLKKHIESDHIANVGVLKQYAAMIKKSKPDVGQLTAALAQDATPHGPIFRSLESRLSDAKSDIPNAVSLGYKSVNKVYQELSAIETAANPDTYGMILSDPINVLADMSEGQLARVAAMSRDASARINNADDFGAGSQLVGNPHYGSWHSGSSGGSFWQWYGQYAFFSSLLHRPIYYNNWGRHRDYSYYHDYGRSAYTSPAQRRGQASIERRTKDKFKRSGKTFNSPYAKTKHTTSQVARTQSRFKPKTMARSSKTTTSSYRSSSYQSSRSSFGGK
ncbi:MAG: hypothetical protein V3T17_07625 [Pseudomonadales bacterium]